MEAQADRVAFPGGRAIPASKEHLLCGKQKQGQDNDQG
jgi:hypothetical protein